jgi:hypothetical protein
MDPALPILHNTLYFKSAGSYSHMRCFGYMTERKAHHTHGRLLTVCTAVWNARCDQVGGMAWAAVLVFSPQKEAGWDAKLEDDATAAPALSQSASQMLVTGPRCSWTCCSGLHELDGGGCVDAVRLRLGALDGNAMDAGMR